MRRKKEVERWVDSGGIIECSLYVKLVIVVPRKQVMVVRWREAAIEGDLSVLRLSWCCVKS